MRSTRFCRPCSELLGGDAECDYELTHLSGPWREVLERPPGPLFFLCLLDLLGDLHGSCRRLREREEAWTEERGIYISVGGEGGGESAGLTRVQWNDL